MRRPFHFLLSGLVLVAAPACHSSSTNTPAGEDPADKAKKELANFKRNPEDRANVRKEPVAEYKVRTDDKLNEQFFSVKLYETNKTMKYLMKVDYEGMGGEDTILLPDLGIPPQPAIEKSPSEKYGCLVGLKDDEQKFREMKKVYVTEKGGELKIKTLKRYAVTENYKLVDE